MGVGYLDRRAGVELRAELGLSAKRWKLKLAAPLRGLLDDGLSFRSADWDELGDYSGLIESLEWGSDAFKVRGGRLVLSAGHGSIVDGYRAGGHPDHQAAGLSSTWRQPRLAAQIAIDRLTDPMLVFSHLRYALKSVDLTSSWVPSIGTTLAIDPKPAAPQVGGIDGRFGIDLESLWRLRDHRVGLYVDGVTGVGPAWAYRNRLHAGILANWFERHWRLGLRIEGRRSADGLPAGPYDNLYALFRHEEHFVRPAASDALGFGAQISLNSAQGNGMTLRLAKDPHGSESMKRVEGRLNWTLPGRGAVYLAGGTWETGQEPPSWYAQGEGRISVTKGLAAWLRLRRMRRTIGGVEEPIIDAMIGLSGALAIRAQ